MKVSARNVLPCVVKQVSKGAVNAEVLLELPGGQEVVSVITLSSLNSLGIEPGKSAHAIIKASSVMIGVD